MFLDLMAFHISVYIGGALTSVFFSFFVLCLECVRKVMLLLALHLLCSYCQGRDNTHKDTHGRRYGLSVHYGMYSVNHGREGS